MSELNLICSDTLLFLLIWVKATVEMVGVDK